MTITRDATSGKYVPANASEWAQLLAGTGIAVPTSLWLCQEASGNLADSIASSTLTAAGTLTYSSAVSGWSRKAVFTSDGNAGTLENTGIGIPTTSQLVLAWISFPASVGTMRSLITLGGTYGDNAAVNLNNTNPTTLTQALLGNQAINLGSKSTTAVHPVIFQCNATTQVATTQTDVESLVSATYPTAGGTNTFILGGDDGADTFFPGATGFMYVALWSGASAELTGAQRTLLLSLLSSGPSLFPNFQDSVGIGNNILSYSGEAFVVGTGIGAKSLILSNAYGEIDIAAQPLSTNGTLWLPSATQGTFGLITAIGVLGGSFTNGGVVFSNTNGVSFGAASAINTGGIPILTITASVAGGAGGIAVAAGTQTATSGTVVFSNSNGVTFGMSNSSVITASVAGGAGGVAVAAGTQTGTSGTIVFSNSNGVSFGMSNSSVVTASMLNRLSVFSQGAFQTDSPISNAFISYQKVSMPMGISVTQAAMLLSLAGNTNSSGALTISLGIYTMSISTASLASSATRQISWTSGSLTTASSQYGGVSGARYFSIPLNASLVPGDYLFAAGFATTNNGTWRVFGSQGPTIVGGYDGIETANWVPGVSLSSSAAFPVSIAVTNTNYNRTGTNALQQVAVIMFGS